jgi:hypothetical protein
MLYVADDAYFLIIPSPAVSYIIIGSIEMEVSEIINPPPDDHLYIAQPPAESHP